MTNIQIIKDLSMTIRMSYDCLKHLKFNLCVYWINLANFMSTIIAIAIIITLFIYGRQMCKFMNTYSKREIKFQKYL